MDVRWGWMVLLMGCAVEELSSETGFAPGEDPFSGPEVAAEQAPPPVPGFTTSLNGRAVRGGYMEVVATLPVPPAPAAGTPVFWAESKTGIGAGPCIGALGGTCLGVLPPVSPLGPVTTAGGQAVYGYDVSPTEAATTLAFQAAVWPPGARRAVTASPVETRVVSAQCTRSFGVNDTNNTYVDGTTTDPSSPSLQAMQIVPASTINVDRVSLFTGESTARIELQIWSHNAGTGQPGAMLASGPMVLDAANDWQGVYLDHEVTLNAGQTYWVVHSVPANPHMQASMEPGGTIVPYWVSFDAGMSWAGLYTFYAWKIRLEDCTFR